MSVFYLNQSSIRGLAYFAAFLGITPLFAATTLPTPMALSSLQSGQWRISMLPKGITDVCLGNPHQLMHSAIASNQCKGLVVDNKPDTATVQYDCGDAGWARSTIHVDNDHSARIDSQGISGHMPFLFKADARRIGSCTAQ
ncbi:MAG: hypothetical protein ABF461_00975 [Zymomonas mobilis subsp. pomaceae]|uniref:DUF3617 family protein n=1 Tax=Zymomonas mobilis subsp. pomaceae (strain ATCC 29192 / DSM 22645 / JCM 10191 / CCUG 17912 / NBRC 13757 / NCIMB 11200 / NRRL B-4491 / Barker I) TaxID=579138 RepID=F8EVS3_ZYMMT|nr:hypothetical protein [Zymomonas mobilis]AEI37400.1 hypothetical protein Zymop_0497 [Zymomonas mobilis subsp. pomaceae ATCC 29192]MDX5948768.1 hypothetical protein [Zymomonas mobilis subsp. pomaceae]GEB88572.1 hypothetical protein ZMO02_02090 [Zymomonas mobilis subsp. pomaceae]